MQGQDFLAVDDPDVIVSGWESIIAKLDVSCEICMASDQRPVVGCGASGHLCGHSDETTGWLGPGLALVDG